MDSHKKPTGMLIVLGVIAVLIIGICCLPEETGKPLVTEGGLIELITVCCYFVTAAMLLFSSWRKLIGLGYSAGIWVFLLALRELDFHDRFTTMGIFKTKFYVSPQVPIVEKTLVTLFVLTLLGCLFLYAKKHLPTLIEGVKKGLASSYTVATAIALMPATKFLNSNGRDMRDFMAEHLFNPGFRIGAIEETAEMGIPILFFLATIYAIQEKKKKSEQ